MSEQRVVVMGLGNLLWADEGFGVRVAERLYAHYHWPEDVEIVPFYDRENLVNLAVHTVTHNLIEGILLVTFIVLIFMADWRTTVIVGIVIPLALLFAFICLRAMGMSANLLSMGAIDFGIIIDGAVVMVEGVLWRWTEKRTRWECLRSTGCRKWGLSGALPKIRQKRCSSPN